MDKTDFLPVAFRYNRIRLSPCAHPRFFPREPFASELIRDTEQLACLAISSRAKPICSSCVIKIFQFMPILNTFVFKNAITNVFVFLITFVL